MDTERPGLFSYWDLLALAGLLALAIFFATILPKLPDPVPSHFNAAGRANGWMPKEQLPWLVFGLPVTIWSILFAMGSLLSMAQQDPLKARVAAFHPMRGWMGLGMAVLMGSCVAIPLYGITSIHGGVAFFFLCMVLGVACMVWEMKDVLASQPDAELYRWGMFYVNPEDERLWVEKRLGVGWTLNYARPAAWWITVLILVPALLIPLGIFLARN